MRPFALAALLAGSALLAACQQQATETAAPETAPELTAEMAEASKMPTLEPVVGADLPTDQTTPEERAEMDKAAADAGVPPTKQSRTTFACDNDETIEVRFFPDQGIAVLMRGGQNVELNGEPVTSGFRYSNGQTTIEGKGDELKMTVGMMAPTSCKAKAA
jgi:membrane-bound inhibitor of C-type lysozyme